MLLSWFFSTTCVLGILQVKERLLKILTFWADRKLYDKDTMQQLEAALLSGDPNAMLQAPAPKQVSSTGHAKAAMQASLSHRHHASASYVGREYDTVSCTGVLCPQMHSYAAIEWTWAVA